MGQWGSRQKQMVQEKVCFADVLLRRDALVGTWETSFDPINKKRGSLSNHHFSGTLILVLGSGVVRLEGKSPHTDVAHKQE